MKNQQHRCVFKGVGGRGGGGGWTPFYMYFFFYMAKKTNTLKRPKRSMPLTIVYVPHVDFTPPLTCSSNVLSVCAHYIDPES